MYGIPYPDIQLINIPRLITQAIDLMIQGNSLIFEHKSLSFCLFLALYAVLHKARNVDFWFISL